MGHAYIGEFRQAFLPLFADTAACPCDNETFQSRNPILRRGTNNTGGVLRKASRSIALSTILGTVEGIAALSNFISKSGAFSRTSSMTNHTYRPRPWKHLDIDKFPAWWLRYYVHGAFCQPTLGVPCRFNSLRPPLLLLSKIHSEISFRTCLNCQDVDHENLVIFSKEDR